MSCERGLCVCLRTAQNQIHVGVLRLPSSASRWVDDLHCRRPSIDAILSFLNIVSIAGLGRHVEQIPVVKTPLFLEGHLCSSDTLRPSRDEQ